MRFGEVLDRARDGAVVASRPCWGHAFVVIDGGAMRWCDAWGDVEYLAPAEDVLADDWEVVRRRTASAKGCARSGGA